jgi:hypothetical protein
MSTKMIAVDNSTEPSQLAELANNPALKLEVTKLDLVRLPGHVKAALYTAATSFSAPQLQTSEYIYAPEVPAPTLTQQIRRTLHL